MKFTLRAGPAKPTPDPAAEPAEKAVPPAEAAALAVFMAVVSRVEAVVEAETEAFTRNLKVDMAVLNHRKRHGLLELSRVTRTLPSLGANAVARDTLARFARTLERNRVVLDRHLRALREIADIVARSLKEAESDGTYSPPGRPVMKTWLVGLWLTAVALGAAYAMALVMPPPGAAAKAAAPVSLQAQKTRVISVPMLADGVVRGFITMQFNYTVDADVLKTLKVPPEIYLLDEAFRAVYTDDKLDFNHLDRYDLKTFTAHLVDNTNAHLGVPLVKEILIDNFTYVDKEQKE